MPTQGEEWAMVGEKSPFGLPDKSKVPVLNPFSPMAHTHVTLVYRNTIITCISDMLLQVFKASNTKGVKLSHKSWNQEHTDAIIPSFRSHLQVHY